MFDFEKPKIKIVEMSDDKRYGRFVVEPLERGYGTTLGNSLRRIMLSSLPGAAVSQIKIDGVLHEFSSIPGVKEDVTEIIMNVKSLAIKNNSETNEAKTAYIISEPNFESFQVFLKKHEENVLYREKIGNYYIYSSDFNFSNLGE